MQKGAWKKRINSQLENLGTFSPEYSVAVDSLADALAGLGDTLRGAIDAYRDAVRPGARVECWSAVIAPEGDSWIQSFEGDFVTKNGGEHTVFILDLR